MNARGMMAFDSSASISDDALMILFANGDGQAAATLAYRHTPRVLALAMRLLRDRAEAEDVAQEALMRLWKQAPNWRQGEAKVSTWLYRVVHNLCIDRLRRRPVDDLENLPEPQDESPSVEGVMIASDRAAALHTALEQLPERQQKALQLRHLQEMSNPEVAEVMETSVEAVESLLSRGRRALKSLLLEKKNELGLD
ncbi:MAG: RNA polymerase sigma factor [Rhodobacteraceae bacterium]|nr:RNA polymerase sigma factor [Paracoccaceae bacterium]